MIFLFASLVGCGADKVDESSAGNTDEEGSIETTDTEESHENSDDVSLCADENSFCGSFTVPANFTGTTNKLSIGLFDELPPAGPPDGDFIEILAPEVVAGEDYQIVVEDFNAGEEDETGEYYIYAALYMEGGGEWVVVSGIDYHVSSTASFRFDGDAVDFGSMELILAE